MIPNFIRSCSSMRTSGPKIASWSIPVGVGLGLAYYGARKYSQDTSLLKNSEQAAIQEISKYKLCLKQNFSSVFLNPKFIKTQFSVSIHSIYGMYDDNNERLALPGEEVAKFDSEPFKNKSHPLLKNIEAVVKNCLQSSEITMDILEKCLNPLEQASREWQKKEVLDLNLGHFKNHNVSPKFAYETLSSDQKDNIDYYSKMLGTVLYMQISNMFHQPRFASPSVVDIWKGPSTLFGEMITNNNAMALDLSHNPPMNILTPMGSFHIAGLGLDDELYSKHIAERFKFVETVPRHKPKYGILEEGPFVSITNDISNKKLPIFVFKPEEEYFPGGNIKLDTRKDIPFEWRSIKDHVFIEAPNIARDAIFEDFVRSKQMVDAIKKRNNPESKDS